ncbi:MAG: hypothetical protein JXA95_06195 [Spirochaetales bacterium]|nr:hypothetical protein [Spirochaetales bacterium]
MGSILSAIMPSVISIDIETKKETVLYHDWEYPALSPFYLPNGEDIAFNRNLQLQVLRKGESIPEPLIGTRSAKDEITLGGVLSVGSYENGCTSNGTWSYDDEYIMYDTSDGHGNQAYAVTPLFEDPQKITTVIFLGLGGKAAWCPLPPGE